MNIKVGSVTDLGPRSLIFNIFKPADLSQISYEASMGWGKKVYSDGQGHMTNMATIPIYGKTLKKYSSLEPKTVDLESLYAALGTIHVIFSWAQIGRSAIFGREIGVPDRKSFSRQKKSSLMSKIVYLHQRRSL